LLKVKQALGLAVNDEVYACFKESSGGFNSRRLATFGVLINRRITATKAEVLWHLYDLNCDGYLQKDEALKMITEIVYLSIEFIYSVVQFMTSDDRARVYLSKLIPRCPVLIQDYMKELFGSRCQLSKQEFIEKLMNNSDLGSLLDSLTVRARASEIPFLDNKFSTSNAFSKF
jgi:hypothetical protein